ncbi:MAG TPA: sigma factor-like helix-turn-helix DNA-binding protein [Anaerolineae bacterium]|nr:sigma factor-like helix-turn-helix DNA-binding protein [Anaerolineae bacterium]
MTNARPVSRTSRSLPRQKVLDYLTPKEQAALLLRWTGLSDRQVAATLGISRAAVAMRLYRARRRLQPWPSLRSLLSAPPTNWHG